MCAGGVCVYVYVYNLWSVQLFFPYHSLNFKSKVYAVSPFTLHADFKDTVHAFYAIYNSQSYLELRRISINSVINISLTMMLTDYFNDRRQLPWNFLFSTDLKMTAMVFKSQNISSQWIFLFKYNDFLNSH